MSQQELPDDAELIAAELAFGLLADDERRAAEQRLGTDADFAAAHARWGAFAAGMAGAGEAPRPSLWAAIEARLPTNDASAAAGTWAAAGAGANRVRPFLAGALAASLACGLVAVAAQRIYELVPAATERARADVILAGERKRMAATVAAERLRARVVLVAVLTGKDRRDSVTVSFDTVTGKLISAPAGLRIGEGAATLWVIPADGKPRSLGVISAAAPGSPRPRARSIAALAPGVTIAVSLEPAGAPPRDAPTGPVILTGKMTSI